MPADNDPLCIDFVTSDQQAEALKLVLMSCPAEQRLDQVRQLLADSRRGQFSLEHLLGASRGGKLVGAAWITMQPGRTAAVWPPQLGPLEPAATADLLLAELNKIAAERGVRLAQALLPVHDDQSADILARGGFSHTADLAYMVSSRTQFPTEQPVGVLEFVPYTLQDSVRMANLIEQTYADTLDCPELNGVRTINDVLDGYAATGQFVPERWFFIRHDLGDVGCLLLTEHPGERQWKVVYLGITPQARGNGWGAESILYAQWAAGIAGAEQFVLAVDTRNYPAIRLYEQVGFTIWDQRAMLLRVFES